MGREIKHVTAEQAKKGFRCDCGAMVSNHYYHGEEAKRYGMTKSILCNGLECRIKYVEEDLKCSIVPIEKSWYTVIIKTSDHIRYSPYATYDNMGSAETYKANTLNDRPEWKVKIRTATPKEIKKEIQQRTGFY